MSDPWNSLSEQHSFAIVYYLLGNDQECDYETFLNNINSKEKFHDFLLKYKNMLEEMINNGLECSIDYINHSIIIGMVTCHLIEKYPTLTHDLLTQLFVFRNEMEYLDIIQALTVTELSS